MSNDKYLRRKEVVTYMLEYNEIYNSIVKEFQLSGSILEKIKESVEALTKSRMEICKLLKVTEFKVETFDANEKELIRNININKANIKEYEKKQIELRDKIKGNKQEIKALKLCINKLDDKLRQGQEESRKLREELDIFLKREKLKIIKKVVIGKYRKVFLKYSSDISIKSKIKECNKRKEKIREEKQIFNNNIERYNRKIIMDKISSAEMRKSVINAEKRIDFFTTKLQSLKDHKEMERKFRLEIQKYEVFNEKR